MSNQETTTKGSEMGIFSDADQPISDTELACTQDQSGKTPQGVAQQKRNFDQNVEAMFSSIDEAELEAEEVAKVMRQIAFGLGAYVKKTTVKNPFTNEEISFNWDLIKVKNNGVSSYSTILDSLMASLESEKVTLEEASSVLAILRR